MVRQNNVNNNDGGRNIKNDNEEFTTLDLIDSLRKEIQRFSDELVRIYPERLNRFYNTELSRFWGKYNGYVEKLRYFKKKDSDYIIPVGALAELKNRLIENYDSNLIKDCLNLINRYENKKLSLTMFLELLRVEIGHKLGLIEVTDYELSEIFAYEKTSLSKIKRRITGRDSKRYTPNFKFDLERLNLLRKNLLFFLGERAKICLEIIKKYENLNQNLKEYARQQYTIENPKFFNDIRSNEQFYWLGVLCADGHLNMNGYSINLKLAFSDRQTVEEFARAVGLPLERILHVVQYGEDENGEVKPYHYAFATFRCKPMAEKLESLGFLKFKNGEIGLLNIVKNALSKAKNREKLWGNTQEGKNALSFLTGFYDGDGNFRGGRSARIASNNKKLLDEIKTLYGSPNSVHSSENRKEQYTLTLGSNLFMAMMNSFTESMDRKRPHGRYAPENYPKRKLDEFYLGNL